MIVNPTTCCGSEPTLGHRVRSLGDPWLSSPPTSRPDCNTEREWTSLSRIGICMNQPSLQMLGVALLPYRTSCRRRSQGRGGLVEHIERCRICEEPAFH